MAKLILLRHLKSQWNEENRFSGWTDVPLSKEGKREVLTKAREVFQNKIDVIFTSPLFRNIDTVARILEAGELPYPLFVSRDGGKTEKWGDFFEGPRNFMPVFVTSSLNERHYGDLEGRNKDEVMKEYGKEKVHLWRRSYKVDPPSGESLKDVVKRTIPFFKKYIEKELKEGKNALVVASHNSLRALVKHIEEISDEDIINFEIPYGGLVEYEFSNNKYIKK